MPVDTDHFIVNEPVLKLDYSFDDSEEDDVLCPTPSSSSRQTPIDADDWSARRALQVVEGGRRARAQSDLAERAAECADVRAVSRSAGHPRRGASRGA